VGNNPKDSQEAAQDDALKKKKSALENQDKLQRIQEQKEYASRVRQARITKGVNDTIRKAEENKKLVQDYKSGRSQQGSNRSQEFGTFYSWIMNSVPEFEAIVKSICYSVLAKRKQYIGGPLTAKFGSGVDSLYYNTAGYFDSKDNIKLPAFKYINEVDTDGKLTFKLMEDVFEDLLKNEKGEKDQELADLSQQIFQGYVNEWLDSLDGLDGEGYFIAKMGNPPEYRVYKKEDGEKPAGSDEYILKPGSENNFLQKDAYENLVQGLGYPEKSLSVYLQNKCLDRGIEFERTFKPGF